MSTFIICACLQPITTHPQHTSACSPSSGLCHQGWANLSLPSLQNIARGRRAVAAAATTCTVDT